MAAFRGEIGLFFEGARQPDPVGNRLPSVGLGHDLDTDYCSIRIPFA
jgi:hypothetical protein